MINRIRRKGIKSSKTQENNTVTIKFRDSFVKYAILKFIIILRVQLDWAGG